MKIWSEKPQDGLSRAIPMGKLMGIVLLHPSYESVFVLMAHLPLPATLSPPLVR